MTNLASHVISMELQVQQFWATAVIMLRLVLNFDKDNNKKICLEFHIMTISTHFIGNKVNFCIVTKEFGP